MIIDKKLDQQKFDEGNVQSLPDRPSLSADDLKAVFDRGNEKLLAISLNGVIDELISSNGAKNIITSNGGSVQTELDKKVFSNTIKGIRLDSNDAIEITFDNVNWVSTASSGHIIRDQNGAKVTQRSEMKFSNSVVTDENGVTVINGIKGDKGDRGIQGIQGVQGIQGIDGKVWIPTVSEAGVITWYLSDQTGLEPAGRNVRGPIGPQGNPGAKGAAGIQGVAGAQGSSGAQGIQGNPGAKGSAGADGRSFRVHGRYDTLAALKAAHPTGVDGDAWAVGSDSANEVYIWDIAVSMWKSIGAVMGPVGAQGIQGVQGVKGDKGAQGIQGTQGIQGVQGERGMQGPEGMQGVKGDPTIVNGKTGASITLNAADVKAVPVDSAGNATIAGNAAIAGNLRLQGSKNYGNKINFGDGDSVSIEEDTNSNLKLRGAFIDLDAFMGITRNGMRVVDSVLAIHSKNGTTHNLTVNGSFGVYGGIITVVFETVADFNEGDRFYINGDPYTASDMSGNSISPFKSNTIVSFEVNIILKKMISVGGASGGSVVSATAPTNKRLLWIDSTSGILKYWNTTAWVPTKAVWG